MDDLTTQISAWVSLLAAISMGAERLVEMIKGIWPWLSTEKAKGSTEERIRQLFIHLLAVGAGILTAFLAQSAIPALQGRVQGWGTYIALGLLASGGSGFWNSILDYVKAAKDIKAGKTPVPAVGQ